MSNWVQYFCNVNDKYSSILVDLDLKDLLPDRRWLCGLIKIVGTVLKERLCSTVWHYVLFNSDEAAQRFIEWSKDNGFERTDRVRSDAPGKLDAGMVCVVQSHRTTPEEIDNRVLTVFRAARQFGG